MSKQNDKSTPSRPISADIREKQQKQHNEHKAEVAIQLVRAMIDVSRIFVCSSEEGESPEMRRCELQPKEQAAYSAALHRLETYFDGAD